MPRPSTYFLSGGKEIRRPRSYALKLAVRSFGLILALALPY
jgi:hypothetical protein